MIISIIGGGALGSALAINYSSNKKKVFVWNRTRLTHQKLFEHHRTQNKNECPENYLTHLEIKPSIEEAVQDSTVVLICIKAQSVYEFLKNNSSFLDSKKLLFSAQKESILKPCFCKQKLGKNS